MLLLHIFLLKSERELQHLKSWFKLFHILVPLKINDFWYKLELQCGKMRAPCVVCLVTLIRSNGLKHWQIYLGARLLRHLNIILQSFSINISCTGIQFKSGNNSFVGASHFALHTILKPLFCNLKSLSLLLTDAPDHTGEQYSKCGLTIALNKIDNSLRGTIGLNRRRKLILLETLFDILSTCWSNFRFESTCKPRIYAESTTSNFSLLHRD